MRFYSVQTKKGNETIFTIGIRTENGLYHKGIAVPDELFKDRASRADMLILLKQLVNSFEFAFNPKSIQDDEEWGKMARQRYDDIKALEELYEPVWDL